MNFTYKLKITYDLMIIYSSAYCDISILEPVNALSENWKIVNCPLEEFKAIGDTILKNCMEFHIKNLIIDSENAVSFIPEENLEWMNRELNSRILYETSVETLILIPPENILTRISMDKFYDHAASSEHGILMLKMRSFKEAMNWLAAREKKGS